MEYDFTMNLRQEAKGRECQVRLHYCNHDSEHVVLHHVRLNTGMGKKPNDILGTWICSSCHAAIHGNPKLFRQYELEGMYRTQEILIREGKIKA